MLSNLELYAKKKKKKSHPDPWPFLRTGCNDLEKCRSYLRTRRIVSQCCQRNSQCCPGNFGVGIFRCCDRSLSAPQAEEGQQLSLNCVLLGWSQRSRKRLSLSSTCILLGNWGSERTVWQLGENPLQFQEIRGPGNQLTAWVHRHRRKKPGCLWHPQTLAGAQAAKSGSLWLLSARCLS